MPWATPRKALILELVDRDSVLAENADALHSVDAAMKHALCRKGIRVTDSASKRVRVELFRPVSRKAAAAGCVRAVGYFEPSWQRSLPTEGLSVMACPGADASNPPGPAAALLALAKLERRVVEAP